MRSRELVKKHYDKGYKKPHCHEDDEVEEDEVEVSDQGEPGEELGQEEDDGWTKV